MTNPDATPEHISDCECRRCACAGEQNCHNECTICRATPSDSEAKRQRQITVDTALFNPPTEASGERHPNGEPCIQGVCYVDDAGLHHISLMETGSNTVGSQPTSPDASGERHDYDPDLAGVFGHEWKATNHPAPPAESRLLTNEQIDSLYSSGIHRAFYERQEHRLITKAQDAVSYQAGIARMQGELDALKFGEIAKLTLELAASQTEVERLNTGSMELLERQQLAEDVLVESDLAAKTADELVRELTKACEEHRKYAERLTTALELCAEQIEAHTRIQLVSHKCSVSLAGAKEARAALAGEPDETNPPA